METFGVQMETEVQVCQINRFTSIIFIQNIVNIYPAHLPWHNALYVNTHIAFLIYC